MSYTGEGYMAMHCQQMAHRGGGYGLDLKSAKKVKVSTIIYYLRPVREILI